MLSDLISKIHIECRVTYAARRVHAELTLGRGVVLCHNQVELLMRRAGLQGISGRHGSASEPTTSPQTWSNETSAAKDRTSCGSQTSRSTRLLAREGKIYCCAILDAYSRRVVGWSIDSSPTAALVTNALGMAFDSRPRQRHRLGHHHPLRPRSPVWIWVFVDRVPSRQPGPPSAHVASHREPAPTVAL